MTKRARRIASLSLMCLLLALGSTSCIDPPFEHSKCRIMPVSSTPSPDGRYEAALEERFCKPETKKILETSVHLKDPRLVPDPGSFIFSTDGKHAVRTVWLDNNHLLIECSDVNGSKILSQDRVNGIEISYKLQ
jgi:hypothetical protein